MAELTADQVRSLDQTRQRLLALHTSLTALRTDLSSPQQPLPSWSSLQTHANLISNNLQQIAAQLSEHQQLLASTIAFPLPQFPSIKSQDVILQTLLRTKLDPDVEEWAEQGQTFAKENAGSAAKILSDGDRHDLWQWAPSAANAEARKQKWGADYTLAEKQGGIDNVVTGLQRQLAEPPDDEANEEDEDEFEDQSEEDEDDDAMEVDAHPKPASSTQTTLASVGIRTAATIPQLSLASVHRFMTTGKEG